jgi:1-phosphofructokinase
VTSGILVWNANPTLDVVSEVEALRVGQVHRAEIQGFSAGGKGTLVVRALTVLGVECLGVAPVAGPTGELVARLFEHESLPFEVIEVSGHTRAAVSIVDREQLTDTVINGPGPETQDEAWSSHVESVVRRVESGAFGMLVIAGRPPLTSDGAELVYVCDRAASSGVRVVVDVSSPVLEVVLPTRPWLVKVNLQECRAVLAALGDESGGNDPVAALQRLGAHNVVLTDGPNVIRGDLLGKPFAASPPAVRVRSAVGCGDCFLAGLLHGLRARHEDHEEAVRWAIAVASAAAETSQPGYFSVGRADELRAGLLVRSHSGA